MSGKGTSWLRLVKCSLLALVPVACSSIGERGLGTRSADLPATPCPAEIQDHVRVTASAAPWILSRSPAAAVESSNTLIGRTLLISVYPAADVPRLSLLSSVLTITTIGGTFGGLAEHSDGARAVDVIPGRLRIAPFITGATLQPQTLSVNLLVTPGGVPLDEMVVRTDGMWDPQHHPLPPDRARIFLEPIQHFTIYDQVEATVSLSYVTIRSRSAREQWACSAESRFMLVDRAATAPDLWDLRKTAERGRSEFWLALFSAKAGPFRAIFGSPADAGAFANWLRQTHAAHVGVYDLGMFRPGYSRDSLHTVPTAHTIEDTFRAVSADDLDALVVGRLGEP
jgi:hypothetical protein